MTLSVGPTLWSGWDSVRLSAGDLPGAARRLAGRGHVPPYRLPWSEAWALNRYAAVINASGDHARAAALYQDALHLARELRQPDDEAHALEGIGDSNLRNADTPPSIACLNKPSQSSRTWP